MSIDVETLARYMSDHSALRGHEGEWADGWDEATRVLLARLVPAEDEATHGTICRCGLAKSYHGLPTNLADHEFVPAVPAEDEGRETIDQRANRMQRERQARVLARKPAEDEGRLRAALREAAEEAHIYGPDHPRVIFEDCPYDPCRKRRAALAATPEPRLVGGEQGLEPSQRFAEEPE
jgi:hypothetical protein